MASATILMDSGNFREKLPGRLNACLGGVHPKALSKSNHCLESLKDLWSHSWGFLWGPPGTGKTTTIGKQVSVNICEDFERILVVSTTNRATDEVALAIGRAVRSSNPRFLNEGRILRIGKSAGFTRYKDNNLLELLQGTETDLLRQISLLQHQLQGLDDPEKRAILRKQIQELLKKMKRSSLDLFISPHVKVVVSTVFNAIALLNDPTIRNFLSRNMSCFSTIIIDEAGLISRATGAVLSLLGSHRVVFVGDPKQLAPISKVSRILPTNQATWLGNSTLNHLQTTKHLSGGVFLLKEQYRMHPEISRVISQFQYDGSLKDSQTVINRRVFFPAVLAGQPRAIWYVLDEENEIHRHLKRYSLQLRKGHMKVEPTTEIRHFRKTQRHL
ncbi:MAG: AAA family ATPase [Candidatus Riflebacteria bacterium]|nr:AAA family ATPase [Candidatus Riflebacteria bacterium]